MRLPRSSSPPWTPRLTARQIAWFLAFYALYGWAGIDSVLLSPRLPFLITDELHRSAGDLARFNQIVAVPASFSLLYGFLRDRWPWGDRRLFLLLIPLAGFLTLPLLGGATFPRLLGCMVATAVVSGMMGVTINATISTMGRRLGAAGRLAGLVGALGALLAAAGQEIGGVLGTLPLAAVLGTVAFCATLLFGLVLRPVEGAFPPPEPKGDGPKTTPLGALGDLLRCRPYVVALLYSLAWCLGPCFGTAFTLRLKSVVGLSPQGFAHYYAIGSVAGVFGGLALAALASRLSPRTVVIWGPLVYLPTVLLLFALRTPADAYAINAAGGFLGSILGGMTFALLLRTVPKGLEGTGLALSGTVNVLVIGQADVWMTGLAARQGYFATVWLTVGVLLLMPFLGLLAPSFPAESGPAPASAGSDSSG